MSYVLDALKKSEQERHALHQRSNASVHAPMSDSKSRRLGLPLILIVVALIAGWWGAQWQNIDTRPLPESQRVGSSTGTSIMKEAPVLDTSENKQAQKVFPEQTDLKQVMPDEGAAEQAEIKNAEAWVETDHSNALSTGFPEESFKKTTVIHAEEEAPVFTLVTPTSPVKNSQPSNAKDRLTAGVQSLHELTRAEQQSIPAIKIDGHIYDVNPKARMVIINGKVRKEKQSISSGLSLQEITPDGVILNYQGQAIQIGVFD